MSKRFKLVAYSLLMVVILLSPLCSRSAQAAESNEYFEGHLSGSVQGYADESDFYGGTSGVSEYAGLFSPTAPSFSSAESASGYIKQKLLNRVSHFEVEITGSWCDESAAENIYNMALADAPSSIVDGDYLRANILEWDIVWKGYRGSLALCTYDIIYTSSYEQEMMVTQRVNALMSELGLNKMSSEYDKVRAIHNYLTRNVSYDYTAAALGGRNRLAHSTYSALILKKTVCQGYASAFYRLAKEAGLQARFIPGFAGELHAWNIVKVGEYWYNIDCTWDEGGRTTYFLKNNEDFSDHYRDPNYETDAFNQEYPMSPYSYGTAEQMRVEPTPEPDRIIDANTPVRDFVNRLYSVTLGRQADNQGLEYWTSQLVNKEKTGAEVAQGFFFSQEFTSKNLSDSDYVDTLYRTMFGREPDIEGKNDWINALANGMSREYVYHGFAEGLEFKNLCQSYGIQQGSVQLTQNRDVNRQLTAFVARNYTVALGRAAELDGLNDWTGRILENRATPSDVTAGFIFSLEFEKKNMNNEDFLTTLYHTYFDREPDMEGYNNWLNQLSAGASREYVVNTGFSCSQEFKNLVAGFGL